MFCHEKLHVKELNLWFKKEIELIGLCELFRCYRRVHRLLNDFFAIFRSDHPEMAGMLRKKNEDPTQFELEIAKTFEKTELGLGHLYFNSAREVELADGKKVAVIYFPMPLISDWKKVMTKVINELEKKLQGRSVFFVGKRTILPKEKKGMAKPKGLQKRPRNRTLTSVFDATLADLVHPALIVGKRINFTPSGSYIKVFLSKQHQNQLEGKLDTISALYKKLTRRNVHFLFDF